MKPKITIPKPCNENWNEMTPTEKGAFCSLCSKEVKDFTKSSDQEIMSVIENSKNEICGHISTKQLNRPLQIKEINLRKWTIPFAASFSLIVIPFSLSAQNERRLLGEIVIKDRITKSNCSKSVENTTEKQQLKGNIKVEKNTKTDSNPEDLEDIINGDIKIEQINSKPETIPNIYVSGIMLIEPIEDNKTSDSIELTKQVIDSTNSISIDTISFKPRQTNTKNKNNPPNATVFPNPTSNWTTIKLENKELYNLSMFNNTGKIVLKKSFFGTDIKINLENQPQGLYYISIINSDGIKSKTLKVIKTD